jgi:integrase
VLETEPSGKEDGRSLAPKTIANKHGFLSGALRPRYRYTSRQPGGQARLPQRTGDEDSDELRMLSRDEFNQLLAATTEPWRPLLEFLVASGCRWGEATALKPSDVDRAAGTVGSGGRGSTTPTATTSDRRRRNVPAGHLPPALSRQARLHAGVAVHQHRWCGPSVIRVSVGRVWDRAVTKSGLDPKPTPHDLRHTCASWMLNAGVPITTVSKHLGHESIKITADIYGHLDRTSAAAAAELMGSLLT